MTSHLCSISNYTDYKSRDTVMTNELETFFTHVKQLMLHQGNGKNLSTKETLVMSHNCPKFFVLPVICGSQRVNERQVQ